MYSEVREVVNFLCKYLLGHIPRRSVGIFGAELGNFLVSQFSSSWDIHHPNSGESERILYVNCPEGSSKCIESSALEAGFNSDVLRYLPTKRIYANPGYVFFRATESGMDVPIFVGDVNADENYQPTPEFIVRAAAGQAAKFSNLGAAGQPILYGKRDLPTDDKAVHDVVNHMFVPLVLEKSDNSNSNLTHLEAKYPYRMVYKPTSAQTYTGIEFSQTRFGSSKARPDLQTMVNIKHLSSQTVTASSSSSSPSNDPYGYH